MNNKTRTSANSAEFRDPASQGFGQHGSIAFFIIPILLAAISTALYEAHQTSRDRDEIQRLQQERAVLGEQIQQLQEERDDALKRLAASAAKRLPRLPSPPLKITVQTNASSKEESQSTNLYDRFAKQQPKLNAKQVEAYLKANGRKASSLLAAYRTSGEPALLQEAMRNDPNDPQVAFEAVLDKDISAEQRRQWLSTFAQSAPDNALANYLSALNYFKAGQTDQAVHELISASGKPQFQDYTPERIQDNEEAYLAAGYSVAEAERISSSWLELPQLPDMKQLGRDMVDLANAYTQSGDQASAQATLQMAVNLGQRYGDTSGSAALIGQLVGISIERMALSAMDPSSPYGGNGQTVQDQLNQIAQKNEVFNGLVQQAEPRMQSFTDQDWINYLNRQMVFGKVAALQWVVSKYGQE